MDSSISSVAPESEGSEIGSSDKQLCASLESLSVQGTPPAEGDSVSMTVDGKVLKIDGDHAYIEVDKVNGQDVPDKPDAKEETTEQELERRASEADQGGY